MTRIKELRKLYGISQLDLATRLGVARSTVAMWETEKSQPDNEAVKRLCSIFDVSADHLLGIEKESKYGATVPVLGNVAAGIPIDAIEDITDYEEIDRDMALQGKHFALRVKGNSMEPRMHEGDVIIVRQQESADDGDIVVALIENSEAAVKRLVRHKKGINLVSFNPIYPPMFFSNEEIEELPVRVIGKVVELRAKF